MWPLLAAQAAFSIYSSAKEAAATEEAAARQKQIDEMNARFLETDATNAEIFGQTETAVYDSQITGTIAEQRTQLAAADVDLSYGTAAELQTETRNVGRMNQIDMRREAFEKAQGLRKQAQSVRMGGEARAIESSAKAGAQRLAGIGQAAQIGMQTYSRYGSTK